MRGKKKLLENLPNMSARELILTARDFRRAADVAAIGGATEIQWREYYEVFGEIKKECSRRFPKRVAECDDYLNRGEVTE